MPDILYRSGRLEVRRIAAGDGRWQVVTFDSYHETHGFDRPGFGEAFFAAEGITATHVLTHGNDWFQYPEMPDVLARIRTACASAERLLSYGSSMGGYAAIRFAAAIGADAALALSPQFSLDRRKVPFETRWAQDQRRIGFLSAIDDAVVSVALAVIAYDPRLDADRRHAQLLGQAFGAQLLPLPHAGHPAGPFLADTGLLQSLVAGLLEGRFDGDQVVRDAHRRRTVSHNWLANLALSQPLSRHGTAVALARRAAATRPDHPPALDALARILAAAGAFEEAVAVHRRILEIENAPDYRWGLTKTLFAAGDLSVALEEAQRLQQAVPGNAGYHAWAAKIREIQGDREGQLADLRVALRLDPGNRAYRYVARRLGWQLRLRRCWRALGGR